MLFGVDISHHQGSVNFGAVHAQGAAFAILKAGEGSTYVDPMFAGNLSAARSAGLLVAAYWYQRNESAAAQVDRILRTVPRDVPVIPDVEANSGNVSITRDIVSRLQAVGYRVPLVYVPRWYWQQIGSPSLAGLPPLWSSRYPDTAKGEGFSAEYSRAPSSYWNGYGGLPVALLQFTDAVLLGGRGPYDGNAFNGSPAQFAALLGGTPAIPAQSPSDHDEEAEMLVPAGTNEHVVIPCAGRAQYWYLYAAFGHRVTVHSVAYVMPTDSPERFAPGGYESGNNTAGWVFESDQPGPVGIPSINGRQPVGVSIRYTADHSFTAYCG